MIYQLSVPAAVPGVDEIRILEWQGAPGTAFEAGDLIVELETHKAVVEVRAGQRGILRQMLAEPGDWRGIGLVLAVFSDLADEAIPESDGAADLKVEFEVT
ncbi:MAG TPA: lipoyl domain-containing protein [Bradyrhizobium sp.]|jgi:pyruvate/2-oxoglutarate dehydrogenase complex dihydrolipoamide acyltransferase (E2) component|nr:lipoyl domain-containing protein [Bradyrhizobium sp.]